MKVVHNQKIAFPPNEIISEKFVRVTVIRKISSDSYIVKIIKSGRESILSAKSTAEMNEGESLFAIVRNNSGKILLERCAPSLIFTGNADDFFGKMFSTMNIPYNEVSLAAVRMFLDMQIKINERMIRKALSLAAKFEGKEKEAAEIAIALMTRKDEVSEESLRNVFNSVWLKDEVSEENQFEENEESSSGENDFLWIFKKIDFNFFPKNGRRKCGRGLLKVLVKKSIKDVKRFIVSFRTEKMLYECVFRNTVSKTEMEAYTSDIEKTEEFASILRKFFPDLNIKTYSVQENIFHPDNCTYQAVNETA